MLRWAVCSQRARSENERLREDGPQSLGNRQGEPRLSKKAPSFSRNELPELFSARRLAHTNSSEDSNSFANCPFGAGFIPCPHRTSSHSLPVWERRGALTAAIGPRSSEKKSSNGEKKCTWVAEDLPRTTGGGEVQSYGCVPKLRVIGPGSDLQAHLLGGPPPAFFELETRFACRQATRCRSRVLPFQCHD